LSKYCQPDITSVVEEINTSLIEFTLLALVLKVNYVSDDEVAIQAIVKSLKRLSLKFTGSKISNFLNHLLHLKNKEVDMSELLQLKLALEHNFH